MNRLKLVVGGVEMRGAPGDAQSPWGLYIKKDGLQGLDDGVAVRRESVEIPGAHGEFDLPVTRGPRVVTLSGVAVERSLFDLGRLRSLLMGIGAGGDLFRVEAEHQAEMVWMQGRIAAAPVFRDRGRTSKPFVGDFELQIVCPNPRKFGSTSSSSAGEPALNYGNFPATPMLFARRISGSGGYTISTASGEVSISAALAGGKTHRIDLSTGSLYEGTSRLSGAFSRFRPWSVLPGVGLVHNVSAGIDLTVETTDTWV